MYTLYTLDEVFDFSVIKYNSLNIKKLKMPLFKKFPLHQWWCRPKIKKNRANCLNLCIFKIHGWNLMKIENYYLIHHLTFKWRQKHNSMLAICCNVYFLANVKIHWSLLEYDAVELLLVSDCIIWKLNLCPLNMLHKPSQINCIKPYWVL